MSKTPQMVIKLLINKEENRVVFAESDGNFVDVLLNFLTLPMGTIIRLLGSQTTVGSMDNLYESVVNFNRKHLQNPECFNMLVRPRNAYENHFRGLTIIIDDSKRTKFYRCAESYEHNRISTIENLKCPCGKYLKKATSLTQLYGGYVEGIFKYNITDDLKVTPVSSSSAAFELLKELRIEDDSSLEEQALHLGSAEVLLMLKRALLSNRTLTDLFLNNQEDAGSSLSEPRTYPETQNNTTETQLNTGELPNTSKIIHLKLMVCKSSNKILYAEANADFVDFVFSFLTLPLGSIIRLLGENSSLGCMDNLYKSVRDIAFNKSKIPEICRMMFLDPKLPQHYKCSSQLLRIDEEGPLRSMYCTCDEDEMLLSDATNHDDCEQSSVILDAINPKLCPYETTSGGGFMNDEITYMVTDTLEIKPLSHMSVLSALKILNVPVHDVEERVVLVREKEGVKLLKASLTSKSILNDVFAPCVLPLRHVHPCLGF